MTAEPAKLQSVARAFRVLEAVGRLGRPVSLSEIATEAGIDKSAAQRMTNALLEMGYLERSAARSGYVPGRRILVHAYDYLRNTPIVERATPALIELRRTVRERVDLSLLDGTSIVYAVRLQSKRENFPATLVGRRLPAFASSGGRAMMSLMTDEEVNAILDQSDLTPLTRNTIHERDAILERIALARDTGCALAVGESLLGEVVLAAPVKDGAGRPLAAVHIAGSLSEWSVEEFEARYRPLAIETAHALSLP